MNNKHNTNPLELIKQFNKLFELKVSSIPSVGNTPCTQKDNFLEIIAEEVGEGNDIPCPEIGPEKELEFLTSMADWLGDIIVYCMSEMLKYGIPIEDTLNIIMLSNLSKAGEDGMPIKDERGKVLKGPNFFPPEPALRTMLASKIQEAQAPD
jgi:hypothetical protein